MTMYFCVSVYPKHRRRLLALHWMLHPDSPTSWLTDITDQWQIGCCRPNAPQGTRRN